MDLGSTHHSTNEHDTIPVVITQTARDVAANLAHQYTDMEAAEQVYRDTLAVYGVHNYLKLLGIESVLDHYARSHPIRQLISAPTTLHIPGLGPIECFAFQNTERSRPVALEAQTDRAGYIAVKLEDDQTAELLGFTETIKNHAIALSQLTAISQLPHLFQDLHITANLRQWLEDIYQQDWQPFEEILTAKQLALVDQVSEAEGSQKARLIQLGEAPQQTAIALCVSAELEDEGLAVHIQIHPIALEQPIPHNVRFVYASSEVLSPNLELALYSEAGNLLKKVIARTDPLDNYIQLPVIHSDAGEKFSVTITLQNASIQQYFRT